MGWYVTRQMIQHRYSLADAEWFMVLRHAAGNGFPAPARVNGVGVDEWDLLDFDAWALTDARAPESIRADARAGRLRPVPGFIEAVERAMRGDRA